MTTSNVPDGAPDWQQQMLAAFGAGTSDEQTAAPGRPAALDPRPTSPSASTGRPGSTVAPAPAGRVTALAHARPLRQATLPISTTVPLARAGEVRGDGVVRRTWRRLGQVVGHDRFPERFTTSASRLQEAVTTGRRIVVVGTCGGSGRSTVAALLGLTLATLRRDACVVVDLGLGPSTLVHRLGVEDPVATSAVAASCLADEPRSARALLSRLARVSDSLYATGGVVGDEQTGGEQWAAFARSLSSACAVTVVDAPGPLSSLQTQMALDGAHAVVLVGTATPLGAQQMLIGAQQVAGLTQAPVLRLAVQVDGRRAGGLATSFDRTLGWDRHLAAAGRIRLDRLTEAHRIAVVDLAADVLTMARGHRLPGRSA